MKTDKPEKGKGDNKTKRYANRKFIDRACRLCGEVPEHGYYLSKVLRSDWVCPGCCNDTLKKQRKEMAAKEDSI